MRKKGRRRGNDRGVIENILGYHIIDKRGVRVLRKCMWVGREIGKET
jgi:hypothetical protein